MLMGPHLSGTYTNHLALCQERMQLNLVGNRLDASMLQQLLNLLQTEVRDSKMPH